MNYSADTWFFLQLASKHPKAIAIWKEIIEGKGRLLVSTVVIAETVKRFLMRKFRSELETLLVNLGDSEKISIAELSKELAQEAGKYAFSYSMTTVDSIILANAIASGHTNIISNDEHFKRPEKQKLIKRIFW